MGDVRIVTYKFKMSSTLGDVIQRIRKDFAIRGRKTKQLGHCFLHGRKTSRMIEFFANERHYILNRSNSELIKPLHNYLGSSPSDNNHLQIAFRVFCKSFFNDFAKDSCNIPAIQEYQDLIFSPTMA